MMSPARAVYDVAMQPRRREPAIPRPAHASRFTSVLLTTFATITIVLTLLAFLPDLRHWFLIGRTYLGAVTMLIPKAFWPDRPPTTLKWTTDAEYGPNASESGQMKSSRVYGIAGEAMLNFGPLGALLAYALFGFLVATLQLFIRTMGHGDSRLLIIPFLINSLFVLLLNDSDNTIFDLIKTGFLPMLLIVSCSQKRLAMPAFVHATARRSAAIREALA